MLYIRVQLYTYILCMHIKFSGKIHKIDVLELDLFSMLFILANSL
jgi:hypothetical protein